MKSMKKLFLTIIIHLQIISFLQGAEVIKNNRRKDSVSVGEYNIYVTGYDIDIIRYQGETVSVTLSKEQELSIKKITSGSGSTDLSCNIVNLPAGVTMNVRDYYLSEKAIGLAEGTTSYSGELISARGYTFPGNHQYTTWSVTRRLEVYSSVPDGEYPLNFRTVAEGSMAPGSYTLRIKTLPTIEVDDIDLGEVQFGQQGEIREIGLIQIKGGTPNAPIKVSLPDGDSVFLKKVGGGGTPILLNVTISPKVTKLMPDGNQWTYLLLILDTSQIIESGSYFGMVVVEIEYD